MNRRNDLTQSRREFLARAAGAAAILGIGGCGTAGEDERLTPACEETQTNPVGPYYRANAPYRTVLNAAGDAGTPLLVKGRVLGGTGCETILAGALLDVWQADDAGDYDNASPEFRYRGRLFSGPDGYYQFYTMVPGHYTLANGDVRPAHLHLKVSADGHRGITTQLYFPDDPFNDSDSMFSERLVMEVSNPSVGLEASFTFVLAEA